MPAAQTITTAPVGAVVSPRTLVKSGTGKATVKEQEADRKHAAVVRIQALFRGFSFRNDWIREDSAILLQAVFRGYRDRVRVSNLIEALFAQYIED